MKTTKTYALFMTLAIVLSIAGFTYAHWADIIQITGTVKMAHVKMTITSYKNLTSLEVKRYSTITSELSADNHTLTLKCDGLRPCWFVWIGLVTQNIGTVPAWVKPPVYTYEDPYGLKEYFENKTYFYGPYLEKTGYGKLEVWGNVKVDNQLKSDGTVNFPTGWDPKPTPFIADPYEKVVIWIWIHCKADIDIPPDAQGKSITMYINIVDDLAI